MVDVLQFRSLQPHLVKAYFDSLIDKHAKLYSENYESILDNFSPFEKSGTNNFYIGMVHSSDFNRVDVNKIFIRGSQSLADNKKIELDLSGVTQHHSFYPGQIVALSAAPLVGSRLSVKEILDSSRIVPQRRKLSISQPVKLLIACGPYCTKNGDWSMFDKLVNCIESKQATHVILLGPFLDIDNEIKTATSDCRSVFKLLLEKLHSTLKDIECSVFMVPSQNDVLSAVFQTTHTFPCPRFNFDSCDELKKYTNDGNSKLRISSVNDPSQIELFDSLLIDVTSVEVLMHLKLTSNAINHTGAHPLIPLYKHLLTQGIYPIYPNHPDLPVDYSRYSETLQSMKHSAHIVVLPTRFEPAVTNVDNALVVAITKCSVKRKVICLSIPKIEEALNFDSLTSADYSTEIVDLIPGPASPN